MRNKKSKIMAIALVTALLLAIIPVGIFTVSAGPATYGDFGYYYNYEGERRNGVEIGYYHGDGGEVIIPDKIEDYPVKTIGYAFMGNKKITGVKIPDGVTNIVYGAFIGCSGLEKVELPSKIKSIEENTFMGCESLTEIKIPEGVTTISAGAFSMCSKLASVSLPASIKEIAVNAFDGCDALTEVTYAGTEEQKKAIKIADSNNSLLSAKWSYNKNEAKGSGENNTAAASNAVNSENAGKKSPPMNDAETGTVSAALMAVMGVSVFAGSVYRKKKTGNI
ncbi:MAG: leucine-rich repeat domain-containing protein [Clostridia bacterium]|nr:leucine-rich repeat domain-containing protein [Clostridia bacterium]